MLRLLPQEAPCYVPAARLPLAQLAPEVVHVTIKVTNQNWIFILFRRALLATEPVLAHAKDVLPILSWYTAHRVFMGEAGFSPGYRFKGRAEELGYGWCGTHRSVLMMNRCGLWDGPRIGRLLDP